MKKIILLPLFAFLSFNISFAQMPDDFKGEIEMLFGELQNSMQQLESLLNDDILQQLDSIDFRSFGIDIEALEESLAGKNLDNLNMDDMMDLMRIQMDSMEDIDFSQFNQFFEQLGIAPPDFDAQPAPANPGTEEEKPVKKKKRKTYKM